MPKPQNHGYQHLMSHTSHSNLDAQTTHAKPGNDTLLDNAPIILSPGQKTQKAWLMALLATAAVSIGIPGQAQTVTQVSVARSAPVPALQQLAAAEDAERETLSRIEHELDIVQRMVEDANKQNLPAQTVKFRYDWLIRDLKLMRDGIASHFDAERQPRPAPVLRGDYRQ